MINADTIERERKRWWVVSALMFLIPISIVLTIFASAVWGSRWYIPFLPVAAKVWIPAAAIGLIAGLRASHLVKWSGSELALVVIHLVSLLVGSVLCMFAGVLPMVD